MKLSRLVFPPDGASRGTLRAHRAYLAVLRTLLGGGIGFLGLWLTACADAALPQAELYRSYLDHPLLLALNLFPPLLLAWLGYFLSGRCWCGVLLSGLFGVGLPLINYYKVMLRGDPMRASDILLLRQIFLPRRKRNLRPWKNNLWRKKLGLNRPMRLLPRWRACWPPAAKIRRGLRPKEMPTA